ncbi:hypothetical protein BaRGS_00009546, partial [Batillaria attramentaria]
PTTPDARSLEPRESLYEVANVTHKPVPKLNKLVSSMFSRSCIEQPISRSDHLMSGHGTLTGLTSGLKVISQSHLSVTTGLRDSHESPAPRQCIFSCISKARL